MIDTTSDDYCYLTTTGRRTGRPQGRILDSGDEADRARSLLFSKYAPRYHGDLTDWRERALPVAIDPVP